MSKNIGDAVNFELFPFMELRAMAAPLFAKCLKLIEEECLDLPIHSKNFILCEIGALLMSTNLNDIEEI